ncbi:MAG: single-stranded DNA-binding protein [Kiritimatiellae bacterium]|nr:single-stranded DNA-binding protein [Kiritimatiellia bacterium]
MASLNKVFLIGNLTKDPDVRRLPSGEDVAEMRLAVNRRFRDRSGKDREETLFINVAVYGNRAAVVGKYLRMGSPVLIEGRLRQEEWTDREGKRQSRISVVAENFEFLGGGRASADSVPADRGGMTEGAEPPVAAKSPVPPEEAERPHDTGGGDRATPWRGGAEPEDSEEDSKLPF